MNKFLVLPLASLILIACGDAPSDEFETASQAATIADYVLPSTAQTLARDYVQCVTGDYDAEQRFLTNRLNAIRVSNPSSIAAAAMSEGWCPMLLGAFKDASPAFARKVAGIMSAAGFDLARPFSRQGTPATRGAVLTDVAAAAALNRDIIVLSARLCWLTENNVWVWISVEPDGELNS